MTSRPLSLEQRASLEEAVSLYEQHRSQVDGYLRERGFDPATVERFRLGYVHSPIRGHERMVGRLAIPAIGPKGNVYSIRFRALDDSEPKYLGLPGIPTRLFNVRAIAQARDVIAINEGELDAMSVEQAGVPAVGVVGVTNWKPHFPRLFEGLRVLVIGDNDEAGQAFVKRVLTELPEGHAVTLDPKYGDMNAVLQQEGVAGVREQLGVH